jgi:hypothetical protein
MTTMIAGIAVLAVNNNCSKDTLPTDRLSGMTTVLKFRSSPPRPSRFPWPSLLPFQIVWIFVTPRTGTVASWFEVAGFVRGLAAEGDFGAADCHFVEGVFAEEG